MTRRYEDMEELLFRYGEGNTSAEEDSYVEQWMKESEANRMLARDMQKLSFAAGMLKVSAVLDRDAELNKIHAKMRRSEKESYRFAERWGWKIAGMLFAFALGGWMVQAYIMNRLQAAQQTIEVRTNPGMTASVVLPDSSLVILNSSSVLTYSSLFADNVREVYLSGEAFFTVKKDKKQFVVHTAHGVSVAVYGTEFNIDAYTDNEEVQATLVTGKVGFSYLDNGEREERILMPGQKAVYDVGQQTTRLMKADVEVDTSWKDGRLLFNDTPFEQVLNSLGKRYGVKFVLKNNKLKANSFTGVFANQRLDRILEHFHFASGIRFRYLEDENMNREKQIIEVY